MPRHVHHFVCHLTVRGRHRRHPSPLGLLLPLRNPALGATHFDPAAYARTWLFGRVARARRFDRRRHGHRRIHLVRSWNAWAAISRNCARLLPGPGWRFLRFRRFAIPSLFLDASMERYLDGLYAGRSSAVRLHSRFGDTGVTS